MLAIDLLGGSCPENIQNTDNINNYSQQIIEPDTGYELASVTINAVTSSIDQNIIADNIREGVTILGITGTLEEGIAKIRYLRSNSVDMNIHLVPTKVSKSDVGDFSKIKVTI